MSHPSPWARPARPRSRVDECDPFRRIGARVIDILVLAPFFAVLIPLGHRHDRTALVGVVLFALSAVYEIVSVGAFGRSIGKLATHIRVVAADGSRATWGQAVVRYAAFSGVAALLGQFFGYVSVVWGAAVLVLVLVHGLGPHDYAASTKVITDIARPASPAVAPPRDPTTKERTTR